MAKYDFKTFASCVVANVDTIAQQAVAFLYFRTRFVGGKATLKELISDFELAGLGRLQLSRLREILTRDWRTRRVANDTWMIPSDRFTKIEIGSHLSNCLKPLVSRKTPDMSQKKKKKDEGFFVNSQRIKELRMSSSDKFDLSRLVRMCEEINDNFSGKNYISVIVLVRTVINHIALIFSFKSFSEVANNYKCEKSLKNSFQHLEKSSRNIADGYLHIPARKKEILPTSTQVNFSQDLDVLLGEVVRILKT